MPRQPILSVLGHVDAGKTTLLDRIRESRIVEGEEGGITQMIGATEVPIETVKDVCGDLIHQLDTELTVPGILFIDTPGHAAFSSLRKRGGSISDIAILVVDIEDGIQPQTEEAIKILQESGTPFVVALNKVDRLHGWNKQSDTFMESLQQQSESVREQLDQEIYELMADFDNYHITIDRFDRVDDFQKKVAVVPLSAKTGEGVPDLLMVLAGLAQRYLSDQLEVEEGMGRGTVLEVSEEEGLGTTVNVIHYDGIIRKDQKLVYGTSDGARVTDIRAILQPRPLEEIRLDRKFNEVEEVKPASGVKIVGRELEGAMAGAPVRVTDNVERAKEEVEEELGAAEFETQREGVVVKADSLGSLEALMRELKDNKIPVQKAEVGKITKSDIIEVQNEDPEYRSIFAFNVSVTERAEDELVGSDIELFQSNVIYEIIDNYTEWQEELKKKMRQNALDAVKRPASIRVLEDHVFRKSDPAVVGVRVTEGVINPGSTLIDSDGNMIGNVKSVQEQNDSLDKAEKGQEVAVSISSATVGRDFEEGETLYTDLTSKQYRQLQQLDDLLSQHEKNVLEKIVEIKDSRDPHWKLG